MIMRFMGDIHKGKRFPHTTGKTAQVFESLRRHTALKLTQGFENSVIQLGDLFDDYSVGDGTLVEGYLFAKKCRALLPGNHDLSKNTDKDSALLLLQKYLGCNMPSGGDTLVFQEGMTSFYLVPHQHTHKLFEGVLESLVGTLALAENRARFNVLCLHCNFGSHTGAESDNYLSEALAKKLLASGITLIVSGHEHNFKRPIPGVVMLGSILPMSFGEMEDKFSLDYDTQTGTYELIKCWDKSSYCRTDWQNLLDQECSTWNTYQFIEVLGDLQVDDGVKVNRKIKSILTGCDRTIAVKNNTVLHRQTHRVDSAKPSTWLETLLASCQNDMQRELLLGLKSEVSNGRKKLTPIE